MGSPEGAAAALRARLDGLRAAGAWAAARDEAAAAADALPDGPARADALVQLGRCLADLGARADAETAWRDAVRVAGPRGERPRALAGAELALFALADGMEDEAGALAEASWNQAALVDAPDADLAAALASVAVVRAATGSGDAEVAVAAAGACLPAGSSAPAGRARALVTAARGSLARTGGRYADALADLADAERLATRETGIGPVDRAAIAGERGVCLRALGRLDEAEAAYREALAALGAVGGDSHPDAVPLLGNVAAVGIARAEADPRAAVVVLREVVERLERAVGAERPEVALHWNNLGGALARAGDLGSAAAAYERALTLKDAHGAPPGSLIVTLVNLAGVQRRRRDGPGAEASYRRALALLDAEPEPDERVRTVILDGMRELGRMNPALISLQPRRRPGDQVH